jgi:hypothetical protein
MYYVITRSCKLERATCIEDHEARGTVHGEWMILHATQYYIASTFWLCTMWPGNCTRKTLCKILLHSIVRRRCAWPARARVLEKDCRTTKVGSSPFPIEHMTLRFRVTHVPWLNSSTFTCSLLATGRLSASKAGNMQRSGNHYLRGVILIALAIFPPTTSVQL